MRKKDTAEILKEITPVIDNIISDKLSKDGNNDIDTVRLVIDKNGDVHEIESKDINNLHEWLIGCVKCKSDDKINERELNDEEKVKESYIRCIIYRK